MISDFVMGKLYAPGQHPLRDAAERVARAFGRVGIKFGMLREGVWYGAPADSDNPAARAAPCLR